MRAESKERFDSYVRIAKHAGLNEPEAVLATLAGLQGGQAEIGAVIRRHSIGQLVCSTVTEEAMRERLPAEITSAFTAEGAAFRAWAEHLLAVYDEVRRALTTVSIPLVLLKGFYFAERLYGGLERRTQCDIDLLVRRKHFAKALRVLREVGFVRRSRDLHSHTVVRGHEQIDLHRFARRLPIYTFDEEVTWNNARSAVVAGMTVQTLCDEDYITLLVLSALEDVGFGKGKLKQMLDLYLLLRQADDTIDWQAYFMKCQAERLHVIAVNVLTLIRLLFGGREEMPRLSAALEHHRDHIVSGNRTDALALLSAPRGAVDNMVWFSRVYPGSVLYYRALFWMRTFPGNLRNFDVPWLRRNLSFLRRSRRPHVGC